MEISSNVAWQNECRAHLILSTARAGLRTVSGVSPRECVSIAFEVGIVPDRQKVMPGVVSGPRETEVTRKTEGEGARMTV